MDTKIITRSLRASEETFKKFVELAEEEGRKQGKLLEILVETYKKSKEECKVKSIISDEYNIEGKEIVVKKGDDGAKLLKEGYRLILSKNLCLDGNTGEIIETDIDAGLCYRNVDK